LFYVAKGSGVYVAKGSGVYVASIVAVTPIFVAEIPTAGTITTIPVLPFPVPYDPV
jgi:hypothetical protein